MVSIELPHARQLIALYLQSRLNDSGWQWLSQRAGAIRQNTGPQPLIAAFAQVPRKIDAFVIEDELEENSAALSIRGWDSVRLARVFLVMHLISDDCEPYIAQLKNLFRYADMDEAVALYSALPVLAWPDVWINQCADGLRSNIGYVHDAIMLNNPYPARYLPEAAWNQLVLKAFFNEKDMSQVVGLEQRNNAALALSLADYRAERLAAGRPVPPLIDQLVAPFTNH